MTKTKKTVDKKLAKLSSEVENISKRLDSPRESIEELIKDLESTAKNVNALYDNIKLRKKEVLEQLEVHDKKQQAILKKEGFKGLKFDEDENSNKKEDDELKELEDAIKQLEQLESEITILRRLVEAKKFKEGKIDQHDAKSFIEGERDRIGKSINKKEKTASANKIVDNLNEEYLKYAKKIIKSNPLYTKSSNDVRNRVDTAQNMSTIKTIIDSRVLYFTKCNDTSMKRHALHFWKQLDTKGIEEAVKADLILSKSGKEVKLNSSNIWELVDKKQSAPVNHPKVDAVNAGQSKQQVG